MRNFGLGGERGGDKAVDELGDALSKELTTEQRNRELTEVDDDIARNNKKDNDKNYIDNLHRKVSRETREGNTARITREIKEYLQKFEPTWKDRTESDKEGVRTKVLEYLERTILNNSISQLSEHETLGLEQALDDISNWMNKGGDLERVTWVLTDVREALFDRKRILEKKRDNDADVDHFPVPPVTSSR